MHPILYLAIGLTTALALVRYIVQHKMPEDVRNDVGMRVAAVLTVIVITVIWPIWFLIAFVVVPIWAALFYKRNPKASTPAE